MAATKSSYAIISVGGKQYRVREGEKLLVDRLKTDEGKTFNPDVLFLGGEGDGTLAPRTQVTARVVGHVLGDKIRIGKRRAKTGYRKQTGFRHICRRSRSSRSAAPRSVQPRRPSRSSRRPGRKQSRRVRRQLQHRPPLNRRAGTRTSPSPTSRRSRSGGRSSSSKRR